MKVGLYSITYLGIWYRGGALALDDAFSQAKKLGYTGVEIDGKRPHGNPMDLDTAARRELRDVAESNGLDIPAVAANNDFSSPVPEHLECQLLMVRELIRLARDLRSPIVRLFLAWPGVTYRDGLASYDVARRRWEDIWRDNTRLEIWHRAREMFHEAAKIAADEGVTLALQNHGPVVEHYRDVLDMVAEVNSSTFQACIDVPLLNEQDDQAVRAAVQETGPRQAHTHFGGEYVRDENGQVQQRRWETGRAEINYPAFVDALRQESYNGYLCYEFCHPALGSGHEYHGRDYVDTQAALAAEYMHALIADQSESVLPQPTGVPA